MDISFLSINPTDPAQAAAYLNWHQSPLMKKNWMLNREEMVTPTYSIENFQEDFSKKDKIAFMIKLNEKYVGYGSCYFNHPVCRYKEGKVCWPSIAIGDDAYRGQGYGYEICKYLLKIAIENNCTHIEAGVFEFNHAMKSLLIRNGFHHFATDERKTFVDSKWWAAEHYLLDLSKI